MQVKKITAGILTYNRRDAVVKAIDSAFNQVGVEKYELEVIVVDGASTDGTAEMVREKYPNVKLICLPQNLGCPGGRNHIYSNSTGDIVVNIDDDGYLENNAISMIAEVFEKEDNVGAVAFTQRFIDEPLEQERVSSEEFGDVNLFRGGVSAFSKKALDKAGYYPFDFFLFGEETYLSLKFIDAGYRIIAHPDIIMWHPRVGSSSAKKWAYLRFRNDMLVITRLYPGLLMWKYLLRRLISDFRWGVVKGTFLYFIRAVWFVFTRLPNTLLTRDPCEKETIRKFYKLRSPVFERKIKS